MDTRPRRKVYITFTRQAQEALDIRERMDLIPPLKRVESLAREMVRGNQGCEIEIKIGLRTLVEGGVIEIPE